MRLARHSVRNEDEEESSFVSMTDMTVSFLFIVMILLVFFAAQMQSNETVPKPLYEQAVKHIGDLENEIELLKAQLAQLKAELVREQAKVVARDATIAEQTAIIKRLEEELARLRDTDIERYMVDVGRQQKLLLELLKSRLTVDFPDLQVVVSNEGDALRFQGDGLFDRGASSLREDKRRIVEAIARRLNELLPCYTLGKRSGWSEDCNEGAALIEAVQVEGHTDSDGSDDNNLRLSTGRANETFFAMVRTAPLLIEHLNGRGQPVLSVAGYGKMRPIATNANDAGKATNRRIDLRIIMYSPRRSDEIQKIKDALRSGVAVGVIR